VLYKFLKSINELELRHCLHSDSQIKSNQINIRLIGKITDTDAKVVYIIPKLLDGRRTK